MEFKSSSRSMKILHENETKSTYTFKKMFNSDKVSFVSYPKTYMENLYSSEETIFKEVNHH